MSTYSGSIKLNIEFPHKICLPNENIKKLKA